MIDRITIKYPFEELPDVWDGEFRAGSHNGFAEIAVLDDDNNWAVSRLCIEMHNGKCGPSAEGKTVEISRAYQGALFEALCDSLERYHGAHIADAIDIWLAEAA